MLLQVRQQENSCLIIELKGAKGWTLFLLGGIIRLSGANFSETCYSVSDLLVIGSPVRSTAKGIATLTHGCCAGQWRPGQFCLLEGTPLFCSFPGKWLLTSNLFLSGWFLCGFCLEAHALAPLGLRCCVLEIRPFNENHFMCTDNHDCDRDLYHVS